MANSSEGQHEAAKVILQMALTRAGKIIDLEENLYWEKDWKTYWKDNDDLRVLLRVDKLGNIEFRTKGTITTHMDGNFKKYVGANEEEHTAGWKKEYVGDVSEEIVRQDKIVTIEKGHFKEHVIEGNRFNIMEGGSYERWIDGDMQSTIDQGSKQETLLKGNWDLNICKGNYRAEVDEGTHYTKVKGRIDRISNDTIWDQAPTIHHN